MRKRFYFISNSSSSSFICEICGRDESGWDLCLSDAEMVECENGHVFCRDEIIDSDNDFADLDEEYEISEKYCPICNFEEPSYKNLRSYFLKTTDITNETVFEEIKKVNKRRKVLRDHEYVEYVLRSKNITTDQVLQNLKETYGTYKEFLKVSRGY